MWRHFELRWLRSLERLSEQHKMQTPGKPGTSLSGACRASLASDGHAHTEFGPQIQALDLRSRAIRRLHTSPHLHRAFAHLHGCGPRPVAEFCAELIDSLGGDPAHLDSVLDWQRLDRQVIARLGADQFPLRRLRAVPR